MAVNRTWRSPDRQWLVDQVVDGPGVQYRVCDDEGAPVTELDNPQDLDRLLTALGVDPDQLVAVPVEDPWRECGVWVRTTEPDGDGGSYVL